MDVFKGITTVVSVPINSEIVLVLVVPVVTTVQVHTLFLLHETKNANIQLTISIRFFMGWDLKFKCNLPVGIKKIFGTVLIQFFHGSAMQFHWG